MVLIRTELPEEIEPIRRVNEQAFGQPIEARIVDKLRDNCPGILSLVAVRRDEIVGHILFSPAEIEGYEKTVQGMGLAPVAVLPECQRQGIGSLLIGTGIEMLKSRGCPFVIVLGHPEYYPRFGFQRASRNDIRCQWEVPDEAFMIMILDQKAVEDASGVARYRSEFDEAM